MKPGFTFPVIGMKPKAEEAIKAGFMTLSPLLVTRTAFRSSLTRLGYEGGGSSGEGQILAGLKGFFEIFRMP
jgi:hypothetical protein